MVPGDREGAINGESFSGVQPHVQTSLMIISASKTRSEVRRNRIAHDGRIQRPLGNGRSIWQCVSEGARRRFRRHEACTILSTCCIASDYSRVPWSSAWA